MIKNPSTLRYTQGRILSGVEGFDKLGSTLLTMLRTMLSLSKHRTFILSYIEG